MDRLRIRFGGPRVSSPVRICLTHALDNNPGERLLLVRQTMLIEPTNAFAIYLRCRGLRATSGIPTTRPHAGCHYSSVRMRRPITEPGIKKGGALQMAP